MKKVLTRIMGLVLAMVLVVTAVGFEKVSAASEYEPYGYVRKVNDKTKIFTGEKGGKIIAECFCESFTLHGFKKGIKKINKALKKIASGFDCTDLYENARIFANEGETNVFYNTVNADVPYADQQYFCVTFLRQWYAGGTSNINLNGIVYDVNTGKKVSITKLTGKKWDEIKKMLEKKLLASKEELDKKDIDQFIASVKESDLPYYINSRGKVVMIIPEYTEPFYGGWFREFELDEIPAVFE